MRMSAFLFLAFLVPSVALAGRGEGGGPPDPERRAKVMEKIETIRIAKLTDALQLDAKSAEKIFPLLRPYNERRRTALGARWEAMRSIEEQLDGEKPDPKVISGLVEDAMKANRELADVAEDEYAALKPVLDPVALARYYRFQIEFEKRIGELIREIRGDAKEMREMKDRRAPEPPR